MKKTLGGDRLGAGKKMTVDLDGFGRSTHNMSYIFRSTAAAGTLIPFLKEVALPGDKFEIDLDCDIKTHPTIGPLFGSYKVQLDVFYAPMRLYQGRLHNNEQKIGMKMSDIKLPQFTLRAQPFTDNIPDINTTQVNPSCLMAYLGIRGVGRSTVEALRNFNAIPWLMYWDIYKNYYANQQEEIGAVIHTLREEVITTVDDIEMPGGVTMGNWPTTSAYYWAESVNGAEFTINYTGARPNLGTIMVAAGANDFMYWRPIEGNAEIVSEAPGVIVIRWTGGGASVTGEAVGPWRYMEEDEIPKVAPSVETFPLVNLDEARTLLLTPGNTPVILNDGFPEPFAWMLDDNQPCMLGSQEGLALKTYQSDLFNNWLSTEWIDGPTGINAITAIDTTSGSINIDTILLSKKVYDMLNRIAVSGGTYDDWQEANYMVRRSTEVKTPVYMGGLIKELVFQEVVSNAEASTGGTAQPLGTLAGKGIMGKKHKGGRVEIRVDEAGYVMGLLSLTPRIDYSQGNKWDVHLKTMDDLHKPGLDEIGFQDLQTDQMAWWASYYNSVGGVWVTPSAGKQPAWVNYMTNVNQVYGNFAIQSEEMFMVLNRRYSNTDAYVPDNGIDDLTTYIDPAKFNHIFAQTDITSQNFWAQIAIDMKARRVMSNKVMPNL